MTDLYEACILCARRCGINRSAGELGFCKSKDKPKVVRAALHMWEEPIISGSRGSGTIFFSGCSLGCVYCQNREISRSSVGREVDSKELSEIMLSLKADGAHNINFVTPTHFAPTVAEAVMLAKEMELNLPIVYNTSSYDSPDTVRMLDGLVDIYLPDLKYFLPKTARSLSFAENYPEVARRAISEMVGQIGSPIIEEGIMKRGVVARILLLPNHVAEAKLSLKYLYDTYGDTVYISLMNQYTPMPGMAHPLDRKVTHSEYYELVEYADRIGVKNGFTQEFGTASESFIPPFDKTGIEK